MGSHQGEGDRTVGDESVYRSAPSDLWLGIATAVWLLLVAAGLFLLMNYANMPGPRESTPADWPRKSELRHSTTRSTLLVFAHPKCPCTRATIDELGWIMTKCGDRLDGRLFFVQPDGESSDWVRSDSWETASGIADLSVKTDPGGLLAGIFGARTSGHAMLYDPAGRLQFEGGITLLRGHRGDNPGRARIVALLAADGDAMTAASKVPPAPVFGCSLFSSTPTTTIPPQRLSER